MAGGHAVQARAAWSGTARCLLLSGSLGGGGSPPALCPASFLRACLLREAWEPFLFEKDGGNRTGFSAREEAIFLNVLRREGAPCPSSCKSCTPALPPAAEAFLPEPFCPRGAA